MSVNGLDADNVGGAYQHALNASNGWFLLHYISRDELGILKCGTDGFHGLQSTITGYSEKSPLYGFLSYRQRHVVLRYIPEGTSRLLQARTSVHLQSIVDRFATHDAVVQFKSLNDVSESTLSDVLELHGDILADEPPLVKHERGSPVEKVVEAQSFNPQVSNILARLKAAKLAQADGATDAVEFVVGHSLPDLPLETASSTRHPPSGAYNVQRAESQADAAAPLSDLSCEIHDVADGQLNHQPDVRPATRMSMDINFAPWKQKEKQFARPVTDEKFKKSQLAGFFRQRLPSGLRRGRKTNEQKSPIDPPPVHSISPVTPIAELKQSPESPCSPVSSNRLKQPTLQFMDNSNLPPTPPPVNPDITESIIRSAEITASAARTGLTQSQNSPQTQSAMTPERQRLMRALSLRRKQLSASNHHENNAQSDARNEMDDHAYAGKTSNVDSGIDLGDTSESEDISPVTCSVPPPTLAQTALQTDGNESLQLSVPCQKRDQLQIDTCVSRRDEAPRKSAEIRAQRSRRSGLTRSRSSKVTCAKSDLECTNPHKWDNAAQANFLVIDQTTEDGYDSSSSNESLIEEMRGAVVEEARRISIPSSPVVKTGFCMDGLSSPYSVTSIVIHTGSNRSRTTSGANSASASCPFPARTINVVNNSLTIKRDNMSSSISKRIQTLNETSNCDRDALVNTAMSPTLLSIKRTSLQHPYQTVPSSSTPDDWLSTAFGDPATYTDPRPVQRPQSVSVTAHIVRSKYGSGPGCALSAKESVDLQRSTLHIQQHIPEDGPSMSFIGHERAEKPQSAFSPKSASRRSSLAFSSRHSIDIGEGVQQLRVSHPKPLSLPGGNLSRTSLDCGDERMDIVKQKRAARMFKRLSASFNNISSRQTIAESIEPSVINHRTKPLPSTLQVPSMFAIGELDVQFPDSLLWKRRWVETNGTGNIILSATRVSERLNNLPKSYHLSQFRTPLIPNIDRQEMPCSVLLEFHHGGTIQFACGDPVSQTEVLRWLMDSHRQWA